MLSQSQDVARAVDADRVRRAAERRLVAEARAARRRKPRLLVAFRARRRVERGEVACSPS